MPTEHVRHLAARIKEQKLVREQGGQLSALQARAFIGRETWKAFVIALSESVDELKKLIADPTWDDLAVSQGDFDSVSISKHQSPYIECTLRLEDANTCIRGAFKTAPQRPAPKQPLTPSPIEIDIRVPDDKEVSFHVNGKRFTNIDELAGEILVTIIPVDIKESARSA